MADIEKGKNPEDFSFQAPTTNTDGTPVSGPLSYKLYRKNADIDPFPAVEYFVLVPFLNPDGSYTAPIADFAEGRHIIALTAVDAEGDESGHSNTLGFSINLAPNPPLLLAS